MSLSDMKGSFRASAMSRRLAERLVALISDAAERDQVRVESAARKDLVRHLVRMARSLPR